MRFRARLAVLFLVGAAALLTAVPAGAAAGATTVTLATGWGSTDLAGGGSAASPAWVPFTTVVTVPAGRPAFSGRLVVRPRALGSLQGYPSGSGPVYEEDIAVPSGSARTYTLFGSYSREANAAFEAALIDAGGQVAVSDAVAIRPNFVTVGVLSDAVAAASLLRGVVVGPTSGQGLPVRSNRFDRADLMPSSVLELTGFHALVIDDFDSVALSQSQGRALRDYVGLGGALILAGGPGWRRTFSQLPEELIPLRPTGTSAASLDSVMELVGGSSAAVVPVATGSLAAGARVVLSDQAGTPLYAEAGYGAGRIVELTFDPGLDPVTGTPLGFQAWAEALNRAVSADRLPSASGVKPAPLPVAPPVNPVPGGGTAGAAGGAGGTGAPSVGIGTPPSGAASVPGGLGSALDGQVFEALVSSPASALPPLGLLGALLCAYILLAGPANYLWTRAARRRELTWVTVPLLAALLTGSAYGAGLVFRGSDFLINEVQLLRLAPTGTTDATLLDVLFAPRRGDFLVRAPEGSLASTFGQYSAAGVAPDHILAGHRPGLALNGFQVWGERNFKLEMAASPGISLEAHLSLAASHIRGTVSNRGVRTISNLALLTVSGEWAAIGTLAPLTTVEVDAQLGHIPAYSLGAGACKVALAGVVTDSRVAACPAQTATLTPSALVALAEVAAGTSVMNRSDVQALVGTVEPLPGVIVQDRQPTRRSVAAFAEPLRLDRLDSLPAGWSGSRLVSEQRQAGGEASVEVRDYDLPGLVAGPIAVSYGTPGVPATAKGAPAPSPAGVAVEVYDWDQRSWTQLPEVAPAGGSGCAASGLSCHLLTAAETRTGLVRVRTHSIYNSDLRVELSSAGSGPA